MKEIWKDIEGYEGLYQVSNMGRVRSLDKYVRGSKGKYFMEGKMKSILNNGKGYCQVCLYKNGDKGKRLLLHRLVAKAFIPNPYNKETINHKNGIKTDNRVENLEWATRSENLKHAYKTGLTKQWATGKFGKDNPTSKKVLQIDKDTGEIIHQYYAIKEASRITGIFDGDICACCKNKKGHYTAGGYIWKYKED